MGLINRLNRYIDSNYRIFKHFTAVFPALFALTLTFSADRIANSLTNFKILFSLLSKDFSGNWNALNNYDLDYLTIIIIVVTTVWLLAVGQIYFYEDKTSKENFKRVEAAIHNTPDFRVFDEYGILCEGIVDQLTYMRGFNAKNKDQPKKRVDEYNKVFQHILGSLCEITKHFLPKEKPTYGANIMIFISNNGDSKRHMLIKQIRDSNTFPYFTDYEIASYHGVLHMVTGLIFSESGGSMQRKEREIPMISLPILKDGSLVLPGACSAVIDGESIFEDTSLIDKYFQDFDSKTKKVAREYFKNQGKDVKSFVSLAIHKVGKNKSENKAREIIGVVNIDCNEPYILGKEELYYQTFYSLMTPILGMISDHLEYYTIDYLNVKETKL